MRLPLVLALPVLLAAFAAASTGAPASEGGRGEGHVEAQETVRSAAVLPVPAPVVAGASEWAAPGGPSTAVRASTSRPRHSRRVETPALRRDGLSGVDRLIGHGVLRL